MIFAPWAAASRAYLMCFSIIDSLSPVHSAWSSAARTIRAMNVRSSVNLIGSVVRQKGRPILHPTPIRSTDADPARLGDPMNPIDLLVLVMLALGLIAGARAGFLGPVTGLIGAAGGFVLALTLASVFRDQLLTLEQPTRALATILGLGAFVLSGEAIGAGIGAMMSRGIRLSPLRPVDMAGGALVGVAHVVLLVWLVGGVAT